jgi:outer membrane lipoprotein-sorting protein
MIKKLQKKSHRWSAVGIIVVIAVSSFTLLNAYIGEAKGEQKNLKGDTIYIPNKQKENYKKVNKEQILTKMINSVDNFETANGEFKVHYHNVDSPEGYTLVEYEISLKNKTGGYNKSIIRNDGKDKVLYHYFKDGTLWDIDESTGTVLEAAYSEPEKLGLLTIDKAFQVDQNGENVTIYRERPIIGDPMASLFPYEIASNYTRDLHTWEIEKQNEELLGHNTVVLKGKLNRQEFQSFRFWIDKDTGILVKYETYNSEGKVVDYLHPTKLEVNVPIDSNRFTPNSELKS